MNPLARTCSVVILLSGIALGADTRKATPTSVPQPKSTVIRPSTRTSPVDRPAKLGPASHVKDVRVGDSSGTSVGTRDPGPDRRPARADQQPPPDRNPPQKPCPCCVDGRVTTAGNMSCRQRGGTCLSSDAEVRQCKRCWCCADGMVSSVTVAACQDGGGTCRDLKGQAEALCNQGR